MDRPISKGEIITVEVAYASKREQFLKRLQVPIGTSLSQAIKLADVGSYYSAINKNEIKTGIYGRFANLETTLQHHDRIEIYRKLTIDPKEIRRKKSETIADRKR